MPIVHVYVWEGFGRDRIKTLIREITRVFGGLGVPESVVEVVVHEVPKTHWGVGGEPASEKFRDKP
ncbi:MAG: tautomerase family protein [Candidatus Bathyarchaeia archaeon]